MISCLVHIQRVLPLGCCTDNGNDRKSLSGNSGVCSHMIAVTFFLSNSMTYTQESEFAVEDVEEGFQQVGCLT